MFFTEIFEKKEKIKKSYTLRHAQNERGYLKKLTLHGKYIFIYMSATHKLQCNTNTSTKNENPDWWLTYVIVSSVHGVLLQTVPHDVPAHEGVRRSLDVLLIVVLFRIDGGLWQATQVHVAWFVFCGLRREKNRREMSRYLPDNGRDVSVAIKY